MRQERTVWHPWHLHLASDARSLQDRVVTDVIAPVVGDLGGRPWFFIRYWQAGPHLRLRIGDLDEQSSASAEQSLRERLAVSQARRGRGAGHPGRVQGRRRAVRGR